VTTRLVPYESLNAQQRQQVEAIEVHPEQIKFSGDITAHCTPCCPNQAPESKDLPCWPKAFPWPSCCSNARPCYPPGPMNTAPPCTRCKSINGSRQRLRQGLPASPARGCACGVAGDQGAGVVGGCGQCVGYRAVQPSSALSTAARRTRGGSAMNGAWALNSELRRFNALTPCRSYRRLPDLLILIRIKKPDQKICSRQCGQLELQGSVRSFHRLSTISCHAMPPWSEAEGLM
jgi:hypothetical protein